MIIDTHCHFFDEEFKDDLEDCINRCKGNGIEKIILVGFSYDTNRKAQEYSKKYGIILINNQRFFINFMRFQILIFI